MSFVVLLLVVLGENVFVISVILRVGFFLRMVIVEERLIIFVLIIVMEVIFFKDGYEWVMCWLCYFVMCERIGC